jgi:hypothetical protein
VRLNAGAGPGPAGGPSTPPPPPPRGSSPHPPPPTPPKSITIITAITVALATAFPGALGRLAPAGEGLAAILMQVGLGMAQAHTHPTPSPPPPDTHVGRLTLCGRHAASAWRTDPLTPLASRLPSQTPPPINLAARRRSAQSLGPATPRPPHLHPASLLPISRRPPAPQVFFAAVGASANVSLVVRTAPVLFAFSALALSAHLALLLGLGRLLGFSRRDLLIASNANIGGPSTVAGAACPQGALRGGACAEGGRWCRRLQTCLLARREPARPRGPANALRPASSFQSPRPHGHTGCPALVRFTRPGPVPKQPSTPPPL